MSSNHLILCPPLFLLPLIFPSIRVFSNELALCIRWPKYWSFSISPSNEYLGFISFWIDWFYLLAVQGTLNNLLQHFSLVHLPFFFLFAMSFNFGSNWHPFFSYNESESCSVMSNSPRPWTVYPWNSPGHNTGVDNLSLLQGVFPAQGWNPGLPHCRWILLSAEPQGGPRILECVAYPFSSRSSRPRNRTGVSCTAGRFFTNSAIREAPLLQLNCQ